MEAVDDLKHYLTHAAPVESEMAKDATDAEFRNLSLVLLLLPVPKITFLHPKKYRP